MNLRTLAHQALTAGLSVVPPRQDGSKAPVGEWKQYQLRLPTGDELDHWYQNGRTGIGIVCGRISGNLEMLEFEGRAVSGGTYADFCEVLERAGLYPIWSMIEDGYLEATPGGGYHVLYYCEGVSGSQKLARRRNVDGGIDVLIETKGEGAYTITAPTYGKVHPTGKPWVLRSGGFDQIATITPEQREQIHRIARSFNKLEEPNERHTAPSDNGDDNAPGHIYNNDPAVVDKTLALLEARGWQKVYTKNDVHYLRRPGKNDGISATLGHPDTGHGFYVFTTSTEFDSERRYSPFAVYTLLEHGGDWSAAARSLREDGYTDSPDLDVTIKLPEPAPEEKVYAIAESWLEINLEDLATGAIDHLDPPPTVLARKDDKCLIYKGEINAINGEPESGKSWIGLVACAQALEAGLEALYIDFEDTASRVVRRLRDLGVSEEAIINRFHYIRPDEPIGDAERAYLLNLGARCEVAVIDGVTDMFAVHGLDPLANKDIADFYATLPRPLANAGPAVVLLDHVVKNKDQRGRYAIGGQHKLAAIRGANYTLEAIQPFGRGAQGHSQLVVTKDRPGHVRPVSILRGSKHVAADFRLEGEGGSLDYSLLAPEIGERSRDLSMRQKIIEYVAHHGTAGTTKTSIKENVKGMRAEDLLDLVEAMVDSSELVRDRSRLKVPGNGLGTVSYINTGNDRERYDDE